MENLDNSDIESDEICSSSDDDESTNKFQSLRNPDVSSTNLRKVDNEVIESEIDNDEVEDDSESDVDETLDDDGSDDQSEENYIKFVRSLLMGDGNIDDEDDEEYRPDDFSDDFVDECDYQLDDDIVKVPKREVEDLVNDCWQTLTGDNNVDIGSCSFVSGNVNGSEANLRPKHSYGPDKQEDSEQILWNRWENQECKGEWQSSILKGIGNKSSSPRLSGISLVPLRHLLAKQISMSNQLLLQILLLSDQNSECFSRCYSQLMELSNIREKWIRKSALLELYMQSTMPYAQNSQISSSSALSSRYSGAVYGDNHPSIEGPYESSPPQYFDQDFRLTRSSVSRRHQKFASLFDSPLLRHMEVLFRQVDVSRQKIHSASDSSAKFSSLAREISVIHEEFKCPEWKCLVPSSNYPLPSNLTANFNPNTLVGRSLFTPAEDDLLMRGLWTYSSHFTSPSISTAAATAERGRNSCFLAENEIPWSRIRASCLPSKEEHSLQFRYSQLTSKISSFSFSLSLRDIPSLLSPPCSDAASSSSSVSSSSSSLSSFASPETSSKDKMKLFLEKLSKHSCDSLKSSKWSHEEDLEMLRGFQCHGNQWLLIKLFFLPQKSCKDIKNRLDLF